MSARRVPTAIVLLAAVLVAFGALAACTRKAQPETAVDDTTATTAAAGTSIAPPPSDPEASTSSTEIDPNVSNADPDEESTDAFGHTEAQIQAFRAAYSQAFEAECRRIWSIAGPSGTLGDPDFPEDQYSVDDCITELDPDYGELNDSVEEAASTGTDDAQIAASDLADPLCAADGTTCWSYGD